MTNHSSHDWSALVRDLTEAIPGGFPGLAIKLGLKSEVSPRKWAADIVDPSGPAKILLLRLARRYLPNKSYELAKT